MSNYKRTGLQAVIGKNLDSQFKSICFKAEKRIPEAVLYRQDDVLEDRNTCTDMMSESPS